MSCDLCRRHAAESDLILATDVASGRRFLAHRASASALCWTRLGSRARTRIEPADAEAEAERRRLGLEARRAASPALPASAPW